MRQNEKHENGQTKKETSSSGRRSNLLFLLLGGGIGAAAALLTAPRTGAEQRAKISRELAEYNRSGYAATSEFIDNLENKSADYYKNLENKSAEFYKNLKHQAREVYAFAAEKLGHSGQDIKDSAREISSQSFTAGQSAGRAGGAGRKQPNVL